MTESDRRRVLARLLLLGAGLAAARRAPAQAAATAEDRAPALPTPGTRIEVPAMPLLDTGAFDPERARGQVLVLYWWASWCPFCAIQSPLMEKLWLAQRGRGLQMLGLSIDRTAAPAQAYRQQRGYTFPSAWVSPAVAQALPKPKGLPVTLVRGRDGRVVMAEAGQLFPEDIEQIARFV
jgi:thiol-disulfide isomerase/thioredoxin